MRLISRIIFSYFSNLTALLIAGAFLPGFEISGNFTNILVAAGVFTLINMYIRPIIRWFLTPLVILTLGLFSLVINAFMLSRQFFELRRGRGQAGLGLADALGVDFKALEQYFL